MKTTFNINTDVSSIIKYVNNASNLKNWASNIDKCSIEIQWINPKSCG